MTQEWSPFNCELYTGVKQNNAICNTEMGSNNQTFISFGMIIISYACIHAMNQFIPQITCTKMMAKVLSDRLVSSPLAT